MNKDASDKIREIVGLRVLSEGVRAGIGFDPIKTGLYSASRMAGKPDDTILIIALRRKGRRYLPAELLLTAKLLLYPCKLSEKILEFCKSNSSEEVIIVLRGGKERDFSHKAAVCIHLEKSLRFYNIILHGYYLTDGADFENIASFL